MGMGPLSLPRNYPPIGVDVKESAADQLFDHQVAMEQQRQQQQQQRDELMMLQQQQGQGGGQQYEGVQQQSQNQAQGNPAGAQKQGQGQGQGLANGGSGHAKGEGGGEEEDARSNVSNSSMRELEDLLTKLNPLAKEFVPPSVADAGTPATSSGGSSKGQPRKVGRGASNAWRGRGVGGGGRGKGMQLGEWGIRGREGCGIVCFGSGGRWRGGSDRGWRACDCRRTGTARAASGE
jgi:hypothetical protein